jgi:hypothetical protein
MDKTTTFYATFYAPGSFCANTWDVPLTSSDPRAIDWPERAYAFQIFERTDAHDGPEVFRGEPKAVGPLYYHHDSRIETLAELRENPRATPTLIGNCEWNKWDQVIWTRWGNWPQAFDPKHTAILGA